MVVGILQDGSVEFGEGYTAGEAVKLFWYELGKAFPQMFQDINNGI